MSKIHLGLKNERMGAWVAAPGFDASVEGGRMLLNSDLDHLKVHQSSFVTSVSDGQEPGTIHWYHFIPRIFFPALPFIPLVIFSCQYDGDLYYPGGANQGAVELPIQVGYDSLLLGNSGNFTSFAKTVVFFYTVYANKVAD